MAQKRIIGYFNNLGNNSAQTGMVSLNTVTEQLTNNAWPRHFRGFAVATASDSPYFLVLQENSYTANTFANASGTVDTLPTGSGNGIAFSPNGDYLAVAHSTTPFITIYKRNGQNLTKLSNPTTLPGGTGNDCAWSPDSTYLAVAHNGSPLVTIYKRSGDTFTKLTNPGTLPTNTCNGVSWSPNGNYLCVAHNTSPFMTVYTRSGDTFTKVNNPVTLPAGIGLGTAWSPDNAYVAVSHQVSPYISVYSFNGTDTLTKVTDPASLPTGVGNDVRWSADGTWLAVAHTATPYMSVYPWSAGFGTKNSNPATLPPTTAVSVMWDPLRNTVYIGSQSTTAYTLRTYSISGNTTTFNQTIDLGIVAPTSNAQRYGAYGLSWFSANNKF